MAIISFQNFSFTEPDCNDGDTFVECNFTQQKPNTLIFVGKNNLEFIRCNMTNCILPESSKKDFVIRNVDFCYHLHPHFDIPIEVEDCKHVIMKKIVDGNLVYIRDDLSL